MHHSKRVAAFAVALALVLTVPAFGSAFTSLSTGTGSGKTSNQPGTSLTTSLMSPILYYQNPDLNGLVGSQNDSFYGNFATAYDNFTLGTTSTIDEIRWIGGYWNDQIQGTITGFTLTFYADAGGEPGSVLWSGSGSGTFGEASLGTDNLGDPIFIYDGFLGSGFTAVAGTQYWISLVPDSDFPPQWGWATSTDGDLYSVQDFLGTRYYLGTDLSFALYGSAATPEPGSLMLLGTGVLGLAGMLRRKLF